MPSLTLLTSLPASSLVADAMPRWCAVILARMRTWGHSCCRLVRFLAPLLSKQEQQINWVLDKWTPRRGCPRWGSWSWQWWQCAHVQGGADNPQAPFVWLHVESADNFKDPETARILTQQLYQFLEEELGFKKVQFLFTKSKLIYVSVFLLWNIQLSGLGRYQFCQDDPNPCWYQRPNFERTFRKMKKIG